jgi:heme A synthase
MKASLFIKVFFVLPLILFVDYILMALLGCTTCLFGLGDEFYCGPFCLAGKIILALSAVLFGYLIYPEIKALVKSKKNVAATESKKDQ